MTASGPVRPRAGRFVPSIVFLALSVPALGVLAAAVAIWVPQPFGEIAPLLVPVYGPALVVLAPAVVLAAAVVVAAGSRGPARRRSSGALLLVAVVASIGVVVPVGAHVSAAVRAGASVNLLDAAVVTGAPVSPPDRRTVYAAAPDGSPLHLSVWLPAPGAPAAPMVVWIHGGGWIAGSDLDRTAELDRWAARGWIVASVEYGLATPGRPTWDLAGPQVACALGALVEDARELGGDPRRLVLAGGSAGGQLAVSVAYRAATGTQSSSCARPVPVPGAVAALYPALDPVDGYEHGGRSPVPELDARYVKAVYTGGTPAEVPERYRAISGLDALSPAAPPTLVLAAGRDHLVPRGGLVRFVDAARARGVDVTLAELPYVDHAFDTVDGSLGQQASDSILTRWISARVG